MVDNIRAADFNTRHLLLALEAGDPYRIARALALEATFAASGGTGSRYAAECAERAACLARESGHPHAEALSALAAGTSALLAGEWKKASLLCARALVVLRDQCTGATWEINCAESFLLGALMFHGEIGEVSRRLPALLTAARDRGNRYFETELRTRMNIVWLAADQPDDGERHANEAMAGWSHQGFHRQHYSHMLARIQTELYRGDAEAAWRARGGQLDRHSSARGSCASGSCASKRSLPACARGAAQRGARTRRRTLPVDRARGCPAHRALRAALVGCDRDCCSAPP